MKFDRAVHLEHYQSITIKLWNLYAVINNQFRLNYEPRVMTFYFLKCCLSISFIPTCRFSPVLFMLFWVSIFV